MKERFKISCDVAVAGGGIAGVAAALAAARMGAKVILLEKTVLWGGLATTGLVYMYLPLCDGCGRKVTGGISEELLKSSIFYGPGTIPAAWQNENNTSARTQRYQTIFSPASFVLAMDELLTEAGVEMWLDTQIIDAKASLNRLESITVANKSGIGIISAAQFIDATGDADLAWMAGLNTPAAANALASWTLERVPAEKTNLAPQISMAVLGCNVDQNVTAPGVSGEMISRFILDGRKWYLNNLKKDYADGGNRHEHYPVKLPAMAQLRHTRRIDGLFTLDSGMEYHSFTDSIGLTADWRCSGKVWEIPFRAMLTAELNNLVATGRCISSTADAWEVTRVIPVAALTGEAAGRAAALACLARVGVADLPVPAVQDAMRNNGNPIHFEEVGLEPRNNNN